MTKYFVIYGFGSGLSMFDGFKPLPAPKCIAYIYKYSDMWRHFDRGLYDFIKRYIYVPLGGSRVSPWRLAVTSLLCFVFIYIWHGVDVSILAFCAANFIGVNCERLGSKIDSEVKARSVITNSISMFVYERFKVVVSMPLLALSLLGVFTFLTGNIEVGKLYVERMLYNSFPVPLLPLMLVFYAFIQSSKAIKINEKYA